MLRLFVALAGTGALLFALSGCAQESPPGGPGVDAEGELENGAVENGAAENGAMENGAVESAPDTGAGDIAAPGDAEPADREEADTEEGRDVADEDRIFRLEVPGDLDVTQGKKQELTISLDRGDDFDQPVKLEFQAPAGIRVVPQTEQIAADEDEVKVFVEAAPEAELGEKELTITGIPATGKPTSITIKVNVEDDE